MQLMETHKYDDIIDLPHPVSPTRAGMPMIDRAAQFAPFAALTGYDAVIEETGRLTDSAAELTESSKQVLDARLGELAAQCHKKPQIRVTCFVPDSRKSGGSYVVRTGNLKRIDEYEQALIFTDGTRIPLHAIYGLEGDPISEEV